MIYFLRLLLLTSCTEDDPEPTPVLRVEGEDEDGVEDAGDVQDGCHEVAQLSRPKMLHEGDDLK